jgi:Xaa-Pro aminopeptidase
LSPAAGARGERFSFFYGYSFFSIIIISAKMQAYMPIVAGSVRASTLHYCCNDRELAWGPVRRDVDLNGVSLLLEQSNGGVHQHAADHDGTRELEPQVLLIDAGCEWDCYASDSPCFLHS